MEFKRMKNHKFGKRSFVNSIGNKIGKNMPKRKVGRNEKGLALHNRLRQMRAIVDKFNGCFRGGGGNPKKQEKNNGGESL